MTSADPSTTIGWGIVGTGRVSATILADLRMVDGVRVVGVASRSLERARAFADEHDLDEAFDSVEALAAHPDVHVVYVGTPQAQHRKAALAAIGQGAGVVVEKSFAATFEGADEMVRAARDAGAFCMEAMWTRFHPVIAQAHALINAGEIGELRSIQADLYAPREFDPDDRLFNPALGGGAMLDLGVYVISVATDFLGHAEAIHTWGSKLPNGVEGQATMVLDHGNGRHSSLMIALTAAGPGRMVLMGTEGHLEILPRFHHSPGLVLRRTGEPARDFPCEGLIGKGYAHEFAAVTEALREGRTECERMPLADTLHVQGLMQRALGDLGIVHHDD
ncbi:Gfo/Idh/MocA family protein [Aestuariimicrobium soli]|uniref:Gfo/Idh/MocA family protein n=1 Tax=Aestuariimicrobium soli TaxID=2035834 RepID=UPI003EB792C9